jgi:hypothetical protein
MRLYFNRVAALTSTKKETYHGQREHEGDRLSKGAEL